MGSSMKLSLNEFTIEDKRKCNDIKSFIGLLQNRLRSKLKLVSK